MREMEMGLKTHAVLSWISFACLILCRPMYVVLTTGSWAGEKKDGAAYVMPVWAGRMASEPIRVL